MAPVLIIWGYMCIYRRKKYAGGATRGPRGRGRTLGGASPTLVTASFVPWSRVQVSWITFGEKITFPEGFIPFGLRLIFRFFETLK